MSDDERQVSVPSGMKQFGRALGKRLPHRLGQLRAIGRVTRDLPRGRPRAKG